MEPIHVVFDAHAIGPRRSGIGEYSLHLCNALVDHCGDDIRLHFYAAGSIRPVSSPREVLEATSRVAERSLYAVGHQFEIPWLLARRRYDVFHAPDFYTSLMPHRTPLVVTIHDVIPIVFSRQLRHSLKSRFLPLFRFFLWRVTRRAAMILTVSEFSRQEICRVLHVKQESVAVTPPAPTLKPSGLPVPDSIGKMLGGRPFLLYVGRRDPNKGLAHLLEAFVRARSDQAVAACFLVIAGPVDPRYPLRPSIEAHRLGDAVIETGYLASEDLSALYAQARAVIMPSMYEGFGIPPLDAMTHGVPVACSSRSSLPEVYGDAALPFDPEDPDGFAAAIATITRDEDLRERLRVNGVRQAAQFTWERTARQTAAAYRRAFEKGFRGDSRGG